jgi:hypothetical protein
MLGLSEKMYHLAVIIDIIPAAEKCLYIRLEKMPIHARAN